MGHKPSHWPSHWAALAQGAHIAWPSRDFSFFSKSQGMTGPKPCLVALVDFPGSHRQWADGLREKAVKRKRKIPGNFVSLPEKVGKLFCRLFSFLLRLKMSLVPGSSLAVWSRQLQHSKQGKPSCGAWRCLSEGVTATGNGNGGNA